MKKGLALFAAALWLSLAGAVIAEFKAQMYSLYKHNYKQDEIDLSLLARPCFSFGQKLSPQLQLQAEYSMCGGVTSTWQPETSQSLNLEHYRAWLRLSLPQSDLRLGLQQLNFGSAQILRPLQWFDIINPLDKAEETEGVKAALFTHNWLNNSNLWLWGILADSETKGNEWLASKAGTGEYGGRVQIPNFLGESALAWHRRSLAGGNELRLGLDHRYDGAIGLWVEASGSKFDLPEQILAIPQYQLSATLGADYTINIGNGIAVTLENMLSCSSTTELDKLRNDSNVTALMLTYPLGLLDNLTFLGVHSHTVEAEFGVPGGGEFRLPSADLEIGFPSANTTNLAIMWRRTYDYLSWDASLSLDSGYASGLSHSPTFTLKLNYDL